MGYRPKRCGAIIKKELGLRKERKEVHGNVPIVVIWDEMKVRKLCPKYGIDFNDLTSLISRWSDKSTDETIQGFYPLKEDDTPEGSKIQDFDKEDKEDKKDDFSSERPSLS